jgi:hypothetical protein
MYQSDSDLTQHNRLERLPASQAPSPEQQSTLTKSSETTVEPLQLALLATWPQFSKKFVLTSHRQFTLRTMRHSISPALKQFAPMFSE